mmetsp:Transcript_18183/g.42294  ORF Transcript_18183/g.42294 Transcript_18183/m.42294 type:complete len:426 (+) Transcript_18183:97-1374(+)
MFNIMLTRCFIAACFIAILDAALVEGSSSRSMDPVQHEKCGFLNMAQNFPPARAVAKLGGRYANHVQMPTWLETARRNLKHKDLHHGGQGQDELGSQPYDWNAKDESSYLEIAKAISNGDDDGQSIFFMNESGIPVGMSSEQYRATSTTKEPVTIFSSYHKTGTVLIMKLIWGMSAGKQRYREAGKALCDGSVPIFSTEPWSNAYSHPYMPIIHVLPKYRFIHFIRDPIHLVVSAYRYHQMGTEQWLYFKRINQASSGQAATSLHLLQEMVQKHGVSSAQKRALAHFRLAARRGLTIFDYYEAAPEEEGAIIQAYHSWPEILLITQNYEASRNDPNALQITTESTQTDFMKSMTCMLSFLSESQHINWEEAMRVIQPLDPASHPEGMSHVTKGKYDNTNIMAVLSGMDALQAARKSLSQPAVRSC